MRTQDSGPMRPIKRIRLRAGLSQSAFAAEMGVAPPNVSVWEAGEGRRPGCLSVKTVRKLQELFPREVRYVQRELQIDDLALLENEPQ